MLTSIITCNQSQWAAFLLQTVYLHCARRGELPNLTEVVKMSKKTRIVGSRSSCSRKDIRNFLLVVNSNLDHISHGFEAIDLLVKTSPLGHTPISFDTLAKIDPFVDEPYIAKKLYSQ